MAFLITCAGSKRQPSVSNPSNLQLLSYNQALFEARLRLLKLTNIHLNWDLTLPAWQIYSGNLSRTYPRITVANWTKSCTDIRILSALFGWIKHTDLLPYYDLRMSDIIPQRNQKVWQYWHSQNLLNQFINQSDVDLLSGDYRKAINGNTNPIATLPDVKFNDYGVQKGNWLNSQLNNIICNQ
jgi:cytoplasmic iron level regulating protein YaaA (DUF328/UPF0246 family)